MSGNVRAPPPSRLYFGGIAATSSLALGYDTVDGRRDFGVVFPILKGRQLRIHCSDIGHSWSLE